MEKFMEIHENSRPGSEDGKTGTNGGEMYTYPMVWRTVTRGAQL
jgi:hypothetical protein